MISIKNILYMLTILFSLSIVYASSFYPEDGKIMNHTQVFFSWPPIPDTNGYELKIYSEEGNQNVLTIYCESNSFIVEDGFNWGNSYMWEICGVDDYSNQCFEENIFSINPIPEYHQYQLTTTIYDENSYQDGINVLDFESLGYSLAINKYGSIVWFADKYSFFNSAIISAELLDNGNLTGFSYGKGYEFTLDSEIVFETPDEFDVHHQISKSANDTYFILDAEIEYYPCPIECDPQFSLLPIPWQGDRYIEINQLGEVLWEWNTFDEISTLEYNPLYAQNYNGVTDFDWTHSNSILYDGNTESVYVSIRNLSRITSIDYSTKEINWNLGESAYMENPDFNNEIGFSQQHSAQLTSTGNLIFFDNARFQNPELSRCLEIDFDNQNEPYVLWEHILPDSMFTGSRGECDRLENGNTLISAGRTGNVIEVNDNNETIWHLRAQYNNGNGISIYRTQRVSHIFPNSFSFTVNNINGAYPLYTIFQDENINLSIFNHGWTQKDYIYQVLENENIILSGDILSISNTIDYTIDISDITIENDRLYKIKLCTQNNLDNCQEISFELSSPILIGDVNNDGEINIFDVVISVNYILTGEFNINADMNLDGALNVQDIILLVNFIL